MGISSPDPSNQPEETPLSAEATNLVIPIVISSDSEDEDVVHDGYEMLPQEANESSLPPEDSDEEPQSDEEEADIPANDPMPSSSFELSRLTEVKELWSSPNNERLSEIIMDSTKEEQVKSAMAGFSLPSSAIPHWAKDIPEEEWKQQLINKINSTNRKI